MPEMLQNILIYAGSFVAVLSLVVFVHEFGHFQVARWRGVAIDTFSIGFGRTLFGWRDKHGVQWKVGALPLGGYVKFADDADAMSTGPRDHINDPTELAAARAKGLFHAQSLATRAMVVAAGPFTNFIFSIVSFAVIALVVGRDTTDVSQIPARLASVMANSAAAEAGLQPGDIIRGVNGAPIENFAQLQGHILNAPGQPLTLTIDRSGETIALTATPRRAPSNSAQGGPREGQGILGISGPLVLESERRVEPYGLLSSAALGAQQTWMMVAQTFSYVGAVFTGRESGDQIAGPIGIINVSGQVATLALDAPSTSWLETIEVLLLSLLRLAAVLSVAVGIVNLLPIPILDGGHLLFYGIEAVRGGRQLPAAAQEWAYRAGFAVMASLFLFATWNDITRLLPGGQ